MERAELDQWKAKDVARLLALVETERRYYQDIVATLPVGLLVVTSDQVVVSANRAFRKAFNLRSDQVLRQTLAEVLPLKGLSGYVQEVVNSGGTRLHILYDRPATPGQKYLRISVGCLRNWEEEADREALILVEDLTDVQTLLQPAALPAPAAGSEIPEPPPDLAAAIRWEADPATLEIRLLNDAAATLLGHPSEAARQATFWWETVAADDAGWVREFFRDAARQTEVRSCDHRMVTAGGYPRWVRSVLRPVVHDGTVVKIAGATIDITDARDREEQLAGGRVLDVMSQWSGRLTHDFNNLLMIVMGYGQELLDSLPARDPRRSDLQEILRTADRVSGMMRELMTLSRPPVAEPETVDLNAALQEMVERLGEACAGRSGLHLSVDRPVRQVNVDPAQLELIVTTLVKQTAQLAPEGSTVLVEAADVELGSRYARPDALPRESVRISLSAAGLRLDAETRSLLFEPLLGAKEPELAPGLFPILGMVRQAGAEVRVEAASDGDTVLALYLPSVGRLEPAPAAEPPEPPPSIPETQPESAEVQVAPAGEAPPGETILVVEDDPGIRALMKKILQRHGYAVLEAAGGKEALELADRRESPIRLLITDLMMPEMGGRALSERIQTLRPEIGILYISGYTDDPEILAGQLPAGAAFLQKPFTLGSLIEKVREILARRAD